MPWFLVVVVDAVLQVVANGQQVAIQWRQVGDDFLDTGPEGGGFQADRRQQLAFDEVMKDPGDPQLAHGHRLVTRHRIPSPQVCASRRDKHTARPGTARHEPLYYVSGR